MKSNSRETEVVIFGEFGCGNLGNEASLDAVLAWLEAAPELAVRCIAREPEAVERMHHTPASAMYSTRGHTKFLPAIVGKMVAKVTDQLRLIRQVDSRSVVVVPGMGVFEQDLSGPPWGLPLTLLGLAVAVRIKGSRLALVGVGASPDTRASVRWMNRRVFAAADFVTFRDGYSRNSAASQGVDVSRTAVFPDVAFSDLPGVVSETGATERIGVGVLSYYDADDPSRGQAIAEAYEVALARFCSSLLRAGKRLEVLIGDASDEAVAERLIEAVSSSAADSMPLNLRYEKVSDHRALARTIARQDVVIGTRYHNLVFALRAGRPTFSIGYARKCAELLTGAGFERYALDVRDLALDDLQDRFASLLHEVEQGADATGFARRSHELSREHRARFLGWVTATQETIGAQSHG